MAHCGEDLAVAVEEEAEEVDELVGADDVFGFDYTVGEVSKQMNVVLITSLPRLLLRSRAQEGEGLSTVCAACLNTKV